MNKLNYIKVPPRNIDIREVIHPLLPTGIDNSNIFGRFLLMEERNVIPRTLYGRSVEQVHNIEPPSRRPVQIAREELGILPSPRLEQRPISRPLYGYPEEEKQNAVSPVRGLRNRI